jgi:hypothetical protein
LDVKWKPQEEIEAQLNMREQELFWRYQRKLTQREELPLISENTYPESGRIAINSRVVDIAEVEFSLAGCPVVRPSREHQSVSQVQTVADYAKLLLACD